MTDRLSKWLSEKRTDGLLSRTFEVPILSFEFVPPRTDAMEQRLWHCIRRLAPLAPRFVSVTYGAGGTTQAGTLSTVLRLKRETDLTPAAHLTCVGATRDEVDDLARRYRDAGVNHIVALRGDPPAGAADYSPLPGGYAYASDLVAGLRRIADFDICVAAYPETHPTASSPEADLDNLKRKLDAGATRAITQYFFDSKIYLRFLDRCLAAGITAPIIPGIMPVSNYEQIVRFSAVCGVTVPGWLRHLFDGTAKNPELRRIVASMVAVEQIRTLQTYGLNEFHVSTLNRSDLTYAIAHILGVRPIQTGASHNLTHPLETTDIPDERETPADFNATERTQEGAPPFMLRTLFG
ncbi:methylenetetrahydrofolate reductase [NAD(P)H] [Acetobacter sp.]|jgi:methylenetetrahydrofolate reductase (NADPH)|uniref:methylenetetrahydrofolate reductase [NAD(P)H] n=1 Tax=Acetobacter sp. TaxID=440 RepID=UPI0025C4983C|nr:methylenetetrahydrofolate reductase [NAD(P)H] [Acetobacter sp.]MCH4091933.1 methylenetetrahydrofolate reductase [NAD(P)H] [Acetobacter sp.]MCI1301358.1 methylenetetrahydrofolate reductase [NAD(P)H] [Acetobacter sp.]MCI1317707.1 methylenetetrahydrofolate reductase [NAD(P)H] [Acetobacter sp.]